MTTALELIFSYVSFSAEAVPRLVDDELYPDELEHVRRAVPKRRAEFGTARICARRGLAAMGIAPVAILPGEGGSPTWPPGVVGSIAHTGGYCAVALGRDPPMRAVGLDVETLQEIEPAVRDLILTPTELAWLHEQAPGHQADLVVTFFCAKEAYYKCQYPVTRQYLDFADVEVDLFPDHGRFVARTREPLPGVPSSVASLEGRFAFEDGRVLCGVELLRLE
jgi:4'-phosphopantetheinyl transferase EntD